jgi:hypothetical protein
MIYFAGDRTRNSRLQAAALKSGTEGVCVFMGCLLRHPMGPIRQKIFLATQEGGGITADNTEEEREDKSGCFILY